MFEININILPVIQLEKIPYILWRSC
ncbi:uncharacterized protein METZ01_LOCUS12644 [marine metagenome]|uniref:Uncharacterized protein n=1 Tax=marine metagenome TaxID=408172 RepID=A0A381NYW4_9ZZZZ